MITVQFTTEAEYTATDDITLDINNAVPRVVQSVRVSQEPDIYILDLEQNTSKVNEITGDGGYVSGVDNLYHFYITEAGEIILNIQPLYNIESSNV